MNPIDYIPADMRKELERAADIVKRHGEVRLVSHFDADGISALAIVREALGRLGKTTEITVYPTLEHEQLDDLDTIDAGCVVMTDLGTSHLRRLSDRGWDIVILDHHKPKEEDFEVPDRDGFVFANPLRNGIDGSKNVCGAGMAYLFALVLDPENGDLAPLAISGMFGDKQHLGGFESIDRAIVDDAVESGTVVPYTNLAYSVGLTFYQAMMSCPEPYFKGTTGQADKVTRFIKSCELNMTDTPAKVSQEKIDAFAEALAARMRRNNVTEDIIKETFGDRYFSPKYGMDVSELSAILDGCGRKGDHMTALSSIDSLDFTEAQASAQEYSDQLISMIEPAFEGLTEMDNIQYFAVEHRKGFAGNIASAIVRYLGNPEKPVIGLTVTDGPETELSSRGTNHQLEKGLNLMEAMKEVCPAFGGSGGGHMIAAGGSITKGKEKDFLKALDEFVGNQFGH